MADIKKNFLYSTVLTTANYLFPLITFPYVSRVLGVDAVGVVNFVDGIVNYFCLFSMMGIAAVGIREVASTRDQRLRVSRTASSLQALNLGLMTVAMVVLGAVTLWVPQLREHSSLMAVGALKLLFTCCEIQWLFKGLEEFRYITMRTLAVKVLYVAGVFLFVHSPGDVLAYYILISGSVGANALINVIYARKWIDWSWRRLSFRRYIKPFFTLGFYLLLTSLYTTFNIIYLGFVATDTEVGYYSTATKLFRILLAVFSAFTGVMLPRMSALVAQGRMDEFKTLALKSFDVLLAVSLPIVTFCTIMAPEVVRLVAGAGYEGAALPMSVVMPLVFIIGYEQILVIQILMPLKADNTLMRNSLIGAASGVMLNVLIVGRLMALGSSIVWISSELVILVLSQIAVTRLTGLAFPTRRLLTGIACYLPLGLGLVLMRNLDLGYKSSLALTGVVTAVWFLVLQLVVWRDGYISQFILGYLRRRKSAELN